MRSRSSTYIQLRYEEPKDAISLLDFRRAVGISKVRADSRVLCGHDATDNAMIPLSRIRELAERSGSGCLYESRVSGYCKRYLATQHLAWDPQDLRRAVLATNNGNLLEVVKLLEVDDEFCEMAKSNNAFLSAILRELLAAGI